MPYAREISHRDALYRSDCCGVERMVPVGAPFPDCDGAGIRCRRNNAHWSFASEPARPPVPTADAGDKSAE
jgi:hypothetical protein